MHSQGNEMLFLAYLNNNPDAISPVGLAYLNVDQPLNMLETIVNAIAVDAFEQAVYTDFYDGPNAEEIMDFDEEKGVYITADEYDLLYKSVYEDLGVENRYRMNTYWRYAVLRSPCYYISYSISALSVLQLLPMGIEDFDAAAASYLKLFSYVDEYENGGSYMSTVEVLEYAGLNTFMEEALYQDINEYFMAKYS
jgi:oligoendopeptidase F